jgi:hypothetical protein
MCCTTPDTFWGGWLLGDLVNLAGRAADLAGISYAVHRLTVEQPVGSEDLPVVTLEVATEDLVYRIHHRLTGGEHDVQCLPGASDTGWAAEVDGIVLRVVLVQDGAS